MCDSVLYPLGDVAVLGRLSLLLITRQLEPCKQIGQPASANSWSAAIITTEKRITVISSVSLVSFITGPRALLNVNLGLAPDDFFSPPCSISPNLKDRSGLGVVLPGVTLHRQAIMAPNPTWGNLELYFEAISKYCCDLKAHVS